MSDQGIRYRLDNVPCAKCALPASDMVISPGGLRSVFHVGMYTRPCLIGPAGEVNTWRCFYAQADG